MVSQKSKEKIVNFRVSGQMPYNAMLFDRDDAVLCSWVMGLVK